MHEHLFWYILKINPNFWPEISIFFKSCTDSFLTGLRVPSKGTISKSEFKVLTTILQRASWHENDDNRFRSFVLVVVADRSGRQTRSSTIYRQGWNSPDSKEVLKKCPSASTLTWNRCEYHSTIHDCESQSYNGLILKVKSPSTIPSYELEVIIMDSFSRLGILQHFMTVSLKVIMDLFSRLGILQRFTTLSF